MLSLFFTNTHTVVWVQLLHMCNLYIYIHTHAYMYTTLMGKYSLNKIYGNKNSIGFTVMRDYKLYLSYFKYSFFPLAFLLHRFK